MILRFREKPVFTITSVNNIKSNRRLTDFIKIIGRNTNTKDVLYFQRNKINLSNEISTYANDRKNIFGLCIATNFTKNVIWCDIIFVDNNFRRQGIGTAIFKGLLDHAYKNHINNILTASVVSDKGTRKFIKRLGFRKVGRIKQFLNKKDYIIWEYPL